MKSYHSEIERGEKEFIFSQAIRLYDVFVFAPLLIMVATKKNLNIKIRIILFVLASTSIAYNFYYLIVTYKKTNKFA